MHQPDEPTSKCKTIYHGVTLIKNSTATVNNFFFLATWGVAVNYSKTISFAIAVNINSKNKFYFLQFFIFTCAVKRYIEWSQKSGESIWHWVGYSFVDQNQMQKIIRKA
jgi:hypothetical protein